MRAPPCSTFFAHACDDSLGLLAWTHRKRQVASLYFSFRCVYVSCNISQLPSAPQTAALPSALSGWASCRPRHHTVLVVWHLHHISQLHFLYNIAVHYQTSWLTPTWMILEGACLARHCVGCLRTQATAYAHPSRPDHPVMLDHAMHMPPHARAALLTVVATEQCLLTGRASAAGRPLRPGVAAAHTGALAAAQSNGRATTLLAGLTAAGMAATAGMWTSRTCLEAAQCAPALARQAVAPSGGIHAHRHDAGAGTWGQLVTTGLRRARARPVLPAVAAVSCTQMPWAACMTLRA